MRLALLISHCNHGLLTCVSCRWANGGALLMLMLAACGTAPAVAPKLLPPNTEQACNRAVTCEAISADDRDQCVTCLEHSDPEKMKEAEAFLEGHPLETWPCESVRAFVSSSDLGVCINADWHWKLQ